jgi:uncharacterized protein YjbJ (UPF0337 family)
MNWDRIEGNWKQFKGTVKERWGHLTDDQLAELSGQRDKLAGKIQEVYGLTRDEAERQLAQWQKAQREYEQLREQEHTHV